MRIRRAGEWKGVDRVCGFVFYLVLAGIWRLRRLRWSVLRQLEVLVGAKRL